MDDEPRLAEVDARIRATLMPDASTASRVAARALADRHRPVAPMRRRYVLAAAAVCTLTAGMVVWQWRPTKVQPAALTSLAITGDGSMIVVESPDGRRWIIGPEAERHKQGSYVIVVARGGVR
jgi:ferric-dicitrate binding protein FerR (iron transport regulator)